ncbi:MAG TPA: hypothetical protein DCR24_07790 [Bacillus bacterium]|nr:hypothetical protein [Bacillus sp. (in: firmicutes)]
MAFYRAATKEELLNALQSFDSIPESVRIMVQNSASKEEDLAAIEVYRKETGVSISDSTDILTEYLRVYSAYEDFDKGFAVYTEYVPDGIRNRFL